ncbi:MAG: prolipoprotein diacylglyceryl transferase family protein [Bacteroidota bacterium]
MYPDLSYIMHALIGTARDNGFAAVKTFGLFLVLAILTSAYFLFLELRRKEKEGFLKPVREKIIVGAPATIWEIIGNGLFGFVLGFKGVYAAMNFEAFKVDPASIVFSGLGNWPAGIALFALFAFLRYWDKNKKKLPKPEEKTLVVHPWERIADITMVAAISGVAGAKIFAVIEDLPALFNDPLGTLFSGGGVAIYGGLIGGFLAVFFYVRSKGIPPIHIMDAVAPALMFGYAVGRIGCQLSGDGDWGIDNALPPPDSWFLPDWMWAYDYPHNVLRQGVPIEGCEVFYCNKLATPVYPTPFYEIVMATLIGIILWVLRKRVRITGMLFFIYLIFNGIERFFIEKIRINDHYDILGMQLTQAEIIALLLVLTGIIGCVYLYRNGERQVLKSTKA